MLNKLEDSCLEVLESFSTEIMKKLRNFQPTGREDVLIKVRVMSVLRLKMCWVCVFLMPTFEALILLLILFYTVS